LQSGFFEAKGRSVSDSLGVSPEKLYRDVRLGKVRKEDVVVDNKRYSTIPDSEITQLEEKQTEKRLRKAIIAALKKTRNIALASARRWVERQEEKGRSLKEMMDEIRRRQEESALRLASRSQQKEVE
jgi:hypothetical protein